MTTESELRERLLAKVCINEATGCWEWTAARTRGYAVMRARINGARRMWYAHRVSYELFVGPIPEGLQIDHLCRNRRCINPEHLEPVTARENLLRGETLTASEILRTHCPRGHAYNAENTYRYDNKRFCRQCNRDHKRKRHQRRTAPLPIAHSLWA